MEKTKKKKPDFTDLIENAERLDKMLTDYVKVGDNPKAIDMISFAYNLTINKLHRECPTEMKAYCEKKWNDRRTANEMI